jgi:hypothetical protein
MRENFNDQKLKLLDKYIEFTDELKQNLESARKPINLSECLGLYLRRTDYIKLKPLGHPIQSSFEEIKDKIDLFLQSRKIKKIFLETEDNNLRQKITRSYKKVATANNNHWRPEHGNLRLIMIPIKKFGDVEGNYLLYLTKIFLLSECSSLIWRNNKWNSNGKSIQSASLSSGISPQRRIV